MLLNIEPGIEEMSAWCKLHGKEFEGEAIPLGAHVYFKPNKLRHHDQSHKFDPDAIPGVLAGYEISPGMGWTRQYRVWALSDFVKQNLAYNTEKPMDSLMVPHLTEKLELATPLSFPLKYEYEKVNNTLVGLRDKDSRGGEPEIPLTDGYSPSNSDDDDDDGDKPDKGPKSIKKKQDPDRVDFLEEAERESEEREKARMDEIEAIAKEMEGEASGPKDEASSVKKPIPEHYLEGGGKAGDGKIYLNDIGEYVKLDKRGHPYRVGEDGRRSFYTSPRPRSEYSPEEWQKLSLKEREIAKKKEELKKKKEKDEKLKKDLEKRKKEKRKEEPEDKGDDESKHVAVYVKEDQWNDSFIYDELSEHDSPFIQDLEAGKKIEEASYITIPAMGALAMRDGESSNRSSESTDVPEDFLIEWDEWAEYSDGNGAKAYWDPINMIDMKTGAVVEEVAAAALIPTTDNRCKYQDFTKTLVEDRYVCFPSLPCIPTGPITHREKMEYEKRTARFYNAMVSRPVGRNEIENNPKAKASLIKEWTGHRESGVYDFKVVKEYDNVVKEAKDKGVEVHMAKVHGICVEKNYQLKEEDPRRKYKGRGVLLGNKVKNQNWESAFFQDLGNSPASFEASRWADFYGCLPGHDVQLADAIQAYIQAKLTGPECWVELPPEAWPSDVNIKGFRRPVVRLVKALYGHPDAGTMWEQHCDKSCKEVGFKPVDCILDAF